MLSYRAMRSPAFRSVALRAHRAAAATRNVITVAEEAAPLNEADLKKKVELSIIEKGKGYYLSLIHISEPTRLLSISYAVFCLKKKK